MVRDVLDDAAAFEAIELGLPAGRFACPRDFGLAERIARDLRFAPHPGQQIAANYVATNAEVAPSLGRPLSGGAANVTVAILEPGSLYGDRRNQLDLRVAKVLRINPMRATLGLDIANATNANPVLTQSPAYATWLRPQTILTARFVKLSVQLNF